jgi:GxxExxY protein
MCEKPFVVKYRERPVSTHRVDLVVRNRLIVELKAVRILERVHEAQVLSYLKASQLPAALLMNFGGATLKEGLRRVILRAG